MQCIHASFLTTVLLISFHRSELIISLSIFFIVACYECNIFFYVFLFLDTISQKLKNSNVFTIAKRNVEGQDMLYQSLKLTNGIWVLAELKIQPNNPNFMVSWYNHLNVYVSMSYNIHVDIQKKMVTQI